MVVRAGNRRTGQAECPECVCRVAIFVRILSVLRISFDRLLLAQALSEPLHLLSADLQLAAYGDLVIIV